MYSRWVKSDLVRKSKYEVGKDEEARHFGAKRIIEIEGIDMNECCGTHVTNLSNLHLIKISRTEKARGCIRTFFIAGASRVTKWMAERMRIERELSGILSCGSEQFVTAVTTLQTAAKSSAKEKKDLLSEIAQADAQRLFSLSLSLSPPVIHSHRHEADLGYLQLLTSLLRDPQRPVTLLPPNAILFLTCGTADSAGGGLFLISSNGDWEGNGDAKAKVSAAIGGRGGGRKGTFQGKCTDLSEAAREIALAVLKGTFM